MYCSPALEVGARAICESSISTNDWLRHSRRHDAHFDSVALQRRSASLTPLATTRTAIERHRIERLLRCADCGWLDD